MAMDFNQIKQYIDQLSLQGDLLEIGSSRGDKSTFILGKIALEKNKTLYSVDMDANLINLNTKVNETALRKLPINFYNMKGEDFLKVNTDLKFSVVLLDNFDWDWQAGRTADKFWINFMTNLTARYKEMGSELTNMNSQLAHLQQAMFMINLLTPEAIVICDDTFQRNSKTYDGKCGAAVPFLMLHGFKIIHSDGAGVILLRTGLT